MKPFHLQIQLVPESKQLNVQWFGQSAIHSAGSRDLPLASDAIPAFVSDASIDLNPLLIEIAVGTISDAEEFQAADEFLLLKDLLTANDFEELCETLYHFLWREAQQGFTLEGRVFGGRSHHHRKRAAHRRIPA